MAPHESLWNVSASRNWSETSMDMKLCYQKSQHTVVGCSGKESKELKSETKKQEKSYVSIIAQMMVQILT